MYVHLLRRKKSTGTRSLVFAPSSRHPCHICHVLTAVECTGTCKVPCRALWLRIGSDAKTHPYTRGHRAKFLSSNVVLTEAWQVHFARAVLFANRGYFLGVFHAHWPQSFERLQQGHQRAKVKWQFPFSMLGVQASVGYDAGNINQVD